MSRPATHSRPWSVVGQFEEVGVTGMADPSVARGLSDEPPTPAKGAVLALPGNLPFTIRLVKRERPLARVIKRVVQRRYASDPINGRLVGPTELPLHRPNLLHDCWATSEPDVKRGREGVTDGDYHHVTDGECRAVQCVPKRDLFSCFILNRRLYRVRLKAFRDRFRKEFFPGVIDRVFAPSQPDPVRSRGPMPSVEAFVFRRWYGALGWVKMCQHQGSKRRPRRK